MLSPGMENFFFGNPDFSLSVRVLESRYVVLYRIMMCICKTDLHRALQEEPSYKDVAGSDAAAHVCVVSSRHSPVNGVRLFGQ